MTSPDKHPQAAVTATPAQATEVEQRPLQGPGYVAEMRALNHPATHILKTWPPYFADLLEGRKHFEARRDDRDFRVGDYLDLIEYDMNDGAEMGLHTTGRSVMKRISYKLDGGQFGIEAGHCVLGLEEARLASTEGREGMDQVETVAFAIAQAIAYRHGPSHKPDDWLNDARREEAKSVLSALRASDGAAPARAADAGEVERVAKALCAVAVENARAKFGNDELASTYGWQDWLPDARAAIAAMPKSDWFLGEVDCDGNELTAVRSDALQALYKRACEVVHHEPGCEHGGRGDLHCTCDAVPFLRDLAALHPAAQAPEVGEVVAWKQEHPEIGKRVRSDALGAGEKARGWTETPLFAHPPATPEPDIGGDPMKGPIEQYRGEPAIARLRQAYVIQQKEVRDQTALVWRCDLGFALHELTRLYAWQKSQKEEDEATPEPGQVDRLREACAVASHELRSAAPFMDRSSKADMLRAAVACDAALSPGDHPSERARLPDDIVRLVIAAREIAFNDWDGDSEEWEIARKELDDASEAFAERVPWDNDPEALSPADHPSKRGQAFCNKCGFVGELDDQGFHNRPGDGRRCNYIARADHRPSAGAEGRS